MPKGKLFETRLHGIVRPSPFTAPGASIVSSMEDTPKVTPTAANLEDRRAKGSGEGMVIVIRTWQVQRQGGCNSLSP